jgi:enolase
VHAKKRERANSDTSFYPLLATTSTEAPHSSMLHSIVASQIFDSRGNPTVRVVVTTDKGLFEAQVPSGASKGSYEAHELRDGGKAYGGQGVLKAVESVNMILAPALLKSDIAIDEQRRIDDLLCQLDGTEQKSKLGANAILGVSMACARAGAAAKEIELFEYIAQIAETLTDVFVLPVPFMNQIVSAYISPLCRLVT